MRSTINFYFNRNSTKPDSKTMEFDLKMAVRVSNDEIIRDLVKAGVDISIIIERNQTLIEVMANKKHWDMVDFIATHRKTNIWDRAYAHFGSALLGAVIAKRFTTVEYLLKAGTPTDWMSVDQEKNHPLHHAVLNQQPEMIALLLKYGASPHSINKNAQTPYDLADALKIGACWNDGWKMSYSRIVPHDVLNTLIQGARQADSPLSCLPEELIDYIGEFLWKKESKLNVGQGRERLYQTSLKGFVNCYSSGFFHVRSAESQQLKDDINQLLEEGHHHLAKEKIDDFIAKSLKDMPEGQYKQSRALTLLNQFHLLPASVQENPDASDQYKWVGDASLQAPTHN